MKNKQLTLLYGAILAYVTFYRKKLLIFFDLTESDSTDGDS